MHEHYHEFVECIAATKLHQQPMTCGTIPFGWWPAGTKRAAGSGMAVPGLAPLPAASKQILPNLLTL